MRHFEKVGLIKAIWYRYHRRRNTFGDPYSKYFFILPRMNVFELRFITFRRLFVLGKQDLVRFLARRGSMIEDSINERILPDALKA
jgi:hypothetical protein